MIARLRPYFLLLCISIVLGCHRADETMPEPTAAVATPASHPVAPGKAPGAPHAPDLANPNVTTAQATEFKPPFAARELFEPPKQAQTAVRRSDEHGQTVELKGFINVDQPRVVLSIDNVIAVIPEGGEKYGVRVRSIQPPTVILERGRNRWPATLE